MKKLNYLFLLTLTVILFSSCSSDDKEADVVFTSLEANKTDVFIEETIVVTIDGSGFTDVKITTTNPKVKITKLTETTYKVTSDETAVCMLTAQLKNSSQNQTKVISLNFYEHGINNFKVIEGIKIKVDNTFKLLKLFGEPEIKNAIVGNPSVEQWEYPSRGITFMVEKSSRLIIYGTVLSSYFISKLNKSFSKYPFEIGNGWRIDNKLFTMDDVINKLGVKFEKSSNGNTKFYQYKLDSGTVVFYFFADSEEDYTGKLIQGVSI